MRHFVRLITCPLFFFILLITLSLSLPALAATTIHVPRDQPTIQAAITVVSMAGHCSRSTISMVTLRP